MEQNFSDDDKTMVFGAAESKILSAEELHRMLGQEESEDIRKYQELSSIGIGGLGTVFSAREPGLNRHVALKILRPEYRHIEEHVESFIREARTTAQIDHPNIVPVHRIGVFDDAGIFFTMKKVEGETLRSVIKTVRKGDDPAFVRRYTLRRRLEIFVSICQAIAFAHSRGVIHCDLKPGNVMIGDYGEVMIMDWGLAVFKSDRDAGNAGHVPYAPGEVRGTPAFMAPEQAAGRNDLIDERTDIYCLGAILYSLLTLFPAPFDPAMPTDKLLAEVIAGRVVRPSRRAGVGRIPAELEAVTMKAMSVNPDDRYQRVQELLDDVRNYLDLFPVSAFCRWWPYRMYKMCRRRPLVPIISIAIVLTLGGVWFARYARESVRTGSLISIAEFNSAKSTELFNSARASFRQLSFGGGDKVSASERRKRSRNYIQGTMDFFSYCNVALDSLASINPEFNSKRYYTDRMLVNLLKREFIFCLETENHAVFRNILRQFKLRCGTLFAELPAKDRKLARQIAMFEKSVATLHLDMPPGTKAFICGNSPDAGAAAAPVPVFGTMEIDSGSYLLKIVPENGKEVFYPMLFRPAGEYTLPVESLPEIPEGMVFVPGGEFSHGEPITGSLFEKWHLPPFFIGRFEVTFGEYLKFWKSISDPVMKNACRGAVMGSDRQSHFLWDDDGKLAAPFREDMPVVGIQSSAAEAYCRYLTLTTGLHFRLPAALEWEKSGRGVDGRTFVWGNKWDNTAALICDNPAAAAYRQAAPGGSFPRDRSCYGVYDLAGNVREFVNAGTPGRPEYHVVGGSFRTTLGSAGCSKAGSIGYSAVDTGFRVVAEIGK